VRPIHDIELLRPTQPLDAALMLARAESRLIAGGTDLMPNLRRGIGTPAVLVDLGGVAGMRGIELGHDQWQIGAGVTLATLARHAGLAASLPAITQAAVAVAGPAHRTSATLGGNLCQDTRCVYYNQSEWWRAANGYCLKLLGDTCHVAPQGKRCHAAYQSDLAAALIACDASVQVVGISGEYRRPLAEMFRDDGAAHLALGPQELLVAVHVPVGRAGRVCGFHKVRARGAMDFPLAAVGVALRMEDGLLAELTVGISGTQSYPLRLQGTHVLLGRPVDDALLVELGRLVQQQVQPMRSTATPANHRRLVASAAAQRLVRQLAEG
jgi:4-hydroxybenzoyl-CoA reductase subunit beta